MVGLAGTSGALAQVAPTPAADAIPERKRFFKTMLAGKPKPRLARSIETAHALPAGVDVCDEMVRLDAALRMSERRRLAA